MNKNKKKKKVSPELMKKFMEAKYQMVHALNERLNKEDKYRDE